MKASQYESLNQKVIQLSDDPLKTPLFQIQLRKGAVEVRVHEHMKDGGQTKDEWPWKLLVDN